MCRRGASGANAAAERLVQTGLDLVAAAFESRTPISPSQSIANGLLAGLRQPLLTRIDALTQSRSRRRHYRRTRSKSRDRRCCPRKADAERAVHDVTIARERLRVLVGLSMTRR